MYHFDAETTRVVEIPQNFWQVRCVTHPGRGVARKRWVEGYYDHHPKTYSPSRVDHRPYLEQ